ncbi:MAG: cytochrome c [candidate division NC10 bacterium]|nr:cytochrome c [candidate division NC10 bacterium]
MCSVGRLPLVVLLLALLALPGRLHGHGGVEHKDPTPHISRALAGPWAFALSVQGGALQRDAEGWITVRILDKKTRQPLTGAKVFIIIPHQHARNDQEWNEHVVKYGGYDDPTRNQELREQNIAETGNAITEEGPPGSYSIRFTPVFANWHEVHVLVMAVEDRPLPERVEAILTVEATKPPPRVTMAELHQHGGVPPGWHFALPPGSPPAGRQVFVKMGCFVCHEVAGEVLPPPKADLDRAGLALSEVGGLHPPEYLAESIIHPNAIIVEGQGYAGPDGLSLMPSYRGLTLQELIDLVAYLVSLQGEEMPSPPEAAPAAHEEGGGHPH